MVYGFIYSLQAVNGMHSQTWLVWFMIGDMLNIEFNNIPSWHGSLVYICGQNKLPLPRAAGIKEIIFYFLSIQNYDSEEIVPVFFACFFAYRFTGSASREYTSAY